MNFKILIIYLLFASVLFELIECGVNKERRVTRNSRKMVEVGNNATKKPQNASNKRVPESSPEPRARKEFSLQEEETNQEYASPTLLVHAFGDGKESVGGIKGQHAKAKQPEKPPHARSKIL
ncbi:hypothetical protein Mgra_00006444 [Meloidogyne graminicola]|uniref:Uncharacterized protein n=1 Tax=Meloidogyne graminicola TaxID=189291 RepID=A0A8S9ZM13_9BILA|nr:hypothetical protein Mgra_00006444 [Meloidogyne graminicola]